MHRIVYQLVNGEKLKINLTNAMFLYTCTHYRTQCLRMISTVLTFKGCIVVLMSYPVACLQGRPTRPEPTQFLFDCLVPCDRENLP
jgi:hypothetical protein